MWTLFQLFIKLILLDYNSYMYDITIDDIICHSKLLIILNIIYHLQRGNAIHIMIKVVGVLWINKKQSNSILLFCCKKYNYNTFQAPLVVFAFNIKKTYLEMRITKKGDSLIIFEHVKYVIPRTHEKCLYSITIIRYDHNYTYERETF